MERSERRRFPRVDLPLSEQCELHLYTQVGLLDISVSGVFMKTDVLLPLGSKGRLQFGLGGTSFAPTVQICRRAGGAQQAGFGTVFRAMDEASRRRLEEFLRKAAS
jgi:hypothetical protein